MQQSNLFILSKVECNDLNEFVNYWRRLYFYGDDSKYIENINVDVFEEAHVVNLFEWKNGMTLKGSGGKEKSLNDKILKRLPRINEYKKYASIDIDGFNLDFKEVSAVWRIFLLHIIKPDAYPIYDQNIHRAYNYIFDIDWQTISNTISDKSKIDFYFNTYLKYVESLGIQDLKAWDEALFGLGQFLKTRNQKAIF